MVMPTPAEMWARFEEKLRTEDPLKGADRDAPPPPHKNMIGAISKYRKIFLEANQIEQGAKSP